MATLQRPAGRESGEGEKDAKARHLTEGLCGWGQRGRRGALWGARDENEKAPTAAAFGHLNSEEGTDVFTNKDFGILKTAGSHRRRLL
jgi:hypothetical protein